MELIIKCIPCDSVETYNHYTPQTDYFGVQEDHFGAC